MKRKLSTSEKVRRLIDQGYTNKAIIEKLGIKPQVVYNMRYQLNKARGLGAIGRAAPTPTEGIGAPPKKRTPRKVTAGTGINPPANDVPIIRPIKSYEPMQPGEWVDRHEPGAFKELPITMIEKPTLWQRIKGWFRA